MSDPNSAANKDTPLDTATKPESSKLADAVEDVPDPDEDDLDDLDDMLDDFSAVKLDSKTAPQSSAPSGSAPSAAETSKASDAAEKTLDDMLGDEEFTKQLQEGMADLLGELDKNPEMQAQFDSVFKSMTAAAQEATSDEPATTTAAETSSSSGGAKSKGSATDASFQETIRQTMERMRQSGDQATAAAADSSSDDFLAEMMKQLGEGGGGDLGEGGDEEFSKMLMGMMEQLTNKEILYEPMKELHDKFPEWLEKNKDKTPAEDLKRYEEQQVLVREIVAKFEEPTYADSNAADREYIVARMQKMQDAGSPPSDLVGDMSSAQDAFSAPDMEGCNPQ